MHFWRKINQSSKWFSFAVYIRYIPSLGWDELSRKYNFGIAIRCSDEINCQFFIFKILRDETFERILFMRFFSYLLKFSTHYNFDSSKFWVHRIQCHKIWALWWLCFQKHLIKFELNYYLSKRESFKNVISHILVRKLIVFERALIFCSFFQTIFLIWLCTFISQCVPKYQKTDSFLYIF